MPTPDKTTPEPIAAWIRGRVSLNRGAVSADCAVSLVLGGTRHWISCAEAIALGTRLLEVGIGTAFAEERAINARIGDLVCEAQTKTPPGEGGGRV